MWWLFFVNSLLILEFLVVVDIRLFRIIRFLVLGWIKEFCFKFNGIFWMNLIEGCIVDFMMLYRGCYCLYSYKIFLGGGEILVL